MLLLHQVIIFTPSSHVLIVSSRDLEKCTDEKGNTYLIGDSNVGWRVSPCLRCDCVGGLLACKRTSEVNFPGHYHGYYSYEENCTQPSCKVSQFIRDNKDKCQGRLW